MTQTTTRTRAGLDVAVIGAGAAGLSTAKVLRQFGHRVTVFEKAPDIGGVWSATRRYPGLRTQNTRDTYAFSDFPMPKEFPEWPSGEQVQQYLTAYARRFGVLTHVHLSTEVREADLDEVTGRWTLLTRHTRTGAQEHRTFDHLVVANGTFSQPNLPDLPGRAAFEAAGGRVLAAQEFHDADEARGKHVVVLGYGKSACDVAAAAGAVAASTTMVVRHLLWKMPRRIGGLVNYKYLFLTRLGEGLVPYQGERSFLHGRGTRVRDAMVGALGSTVSRQLGLTRLELQPEAPFDTIARSTVSLATDELFEQLHRGTTEVLHNTAVARLGTGPHGPQVELTDGRVLHADLLLAGTGFRQEVPFLSADLQARITDSGGNFLLHRHILPPDVPHLTFAGYNSSLYSLLNAEVGALWTAALLMGRLDLPSSELRRAAARIRVRWMAERTNGKHARGTNIIPFSLHNVDDLLNDLGLNVSALTRAKQWLLPVNADDYREVTTRLLEWLPAEVPTAVVRAA